MIADDDNMDSGPDGDSYMDTNDSDGCDFSDLSPDDQRKMIDFVMQGKPQTPQNVNAARNLLLKDPETVESLCEKLDIKMPGDDDTNDSDEGVSDNG